MVGSGPTLASERPGQRSSAGLCAHSERNKSPRKASLRWAVSGVGLPCSKARLFRWKMVLRLVSPAWARGRPACRTAWFMRVVISAVATWINHVARIKLLLNDARHFFFFFHRCLNPPSGNHSDENCVGRWLFLMVQCSNQGEPLGINLLLGFC